MVDAGVAIRLPTPVWLDVNNKIVETEAEACGQKTRYLLIQPEFVLFADETGSNTNQKEDRRIGGELFVVPVSDDGVGQPQICISPLCVFPLLLVIRFLESLY